MPRIILSFFSPRIFCFLAILSLGSKTFSQTLSGTVIDPSGTGIAGAQVTHFPSGVQTLSAADGSWTLTPSPIAPPQNSLGEIQLRQQTLRFSILSPGQKVWIAMYTPEGRHLKTLLDEKLTSGTYILNNIHRGLAKGVAVVRMKLGQREHSFSLNVPQTTDPAELPWERLGSPGMSLAKNSAPGDSITAAKTGYLPAYIILQAGQETGITLTLAPDAQTSGYKLPPPDGCYNQFFVSGCTEGDPNSTCGGECRVANSCSPPEDPSKGNLPKNFICPRFMLFSADMLQAARDDAQQYGWSDGSDSPFIYGVVGHDADVGGLDELNSSCCQCYQLIFETPEPSSPPFPELPHPKSMVVQSFNTAASGPKGFDIFMGAGGYGAFNSCYDDPNFGNSTNFGEFLYEEYPWQNPGSGGISFLRYPECVGSDWPPTAAGLQSPECAQTLVQQCGQARAVTDQVTEDTRNSCLQTNQLESLYHQNWKVRAKRVQCPENLTRVTGCRLQEDHLPMPLPEVQTPEQAGANGTFTGPDEQYHTTTMQDCCMPTCAWSDWVEGQGLQPVEGWNSFYSCDGLGNPRTE